MNTRRSINRLSKIFLLFFLFLVSTENINARSNELLYSEEFYEPVIAKAISTSTELSEFLPGFSSLIYQNKDFIAGSEVVLNVDKSSYYTFTLECEQIGCYEEVYLSLSHDKNNSRDLYSPYKIWKLDKGEYKLNLEGLDYDKDYSLVIHRSDLPLNGRVLFLSPLESLDLELIDRFAKSGGLVISYSNLELEERYGLESESEEFILTSSRYFGVGWESSNIQTFNLKESSNRSVIGYEAHYNGIEGELHKNRLQGYLSVFIPREKGGVIIVSESIAALREGDFLFAVSDPLVDHFGETSDLLQMILTAFSVFILIIALALLLFIDFDRSLKPNVNFPKFKVQLTKDSHFARFVIGLSRTVLMIFAVLGACFSLLWVGYARRYYSEDILGNIDKLNLKFNSYSLDNFSGIVLSIVQILFVIWVLAILVLRSRDYWEVVRIYTKKISGLIKGKVSSIYVRIVIIGTILLLIFVLLIRILTVDSYLVKVESDSYLNGNPFSKEYSVKDQIKYRGWDEQLVKVGFNSSFNSDNDVFATVSSQGSSDRILVYSEAFKGFESINRFNDYSARTNGNESYNSIESLLDSLPQGESLGIDKYSISNKYKNVSDELLSYSQFLAIPEEGYKTVSSVDYKLGEMSSDLEVLFAFSGGELHIDLEGLDRNMDWGVDNLSLTVLDQDNNIIEQEFYYDDKKPIGTNETLFTIQIDKALEKGVYKAVLSSDIHSPLTTEVGSTNKDLAYKTFSINSKQIWLRSLSNKIYFYDEAELVVLNHGDLELYSGTLEESLSSEIGEYQDLEVNSQTNINASHSLITFPTTNTEWYPYKYFLTSPSAKNRILLTRDKAFIHNVHFLSDIAFKLETLDKTPFSIGRDIEIDITSE